MRNTKKNRRYLREKRVDQIYDIGMFWKEYEEHFLPIIEQYRMNRFRVSEYQFRRSCWQDANLCPGFLLFEEKAMEIMQIRWFSIGFDFTRWIDFRHKQNGRDGWDWTYKPRSISARWSYTRRLDRRKDRYEARRVIRAEIKEMDI